MDTLKRDDSAGLLAEAKCFALRALNNCRGARRAAIRRCRAREPHRQSDNYPDPPRVALHSCEHPDEIRWPLSGPGEVRFRWQSAVYGQTSEVEAISQDSAGRLMRITGTVAVANEPPEFAQ